MPSDQNQTTGLFGALPAQPHPSARIKWCGYPAPEGRHPAQDCLRWMGGSVDASADCLGCVHMVMSTKTEASSHERS